MGNNEVNFEELRSLIPYASEEEICEIIKTIVTLVPLGENKAFYLKTLFNFLKDLVSGDEISQYVNATYVTPYAKEALNEIGEHIRTNQLQEYRRTLGPLRNEVSELSVTKDILQSEIAALKLERDNLLLGNATIRSSISQEQAEVEELREQEHRLSESLRNLQTAIKEYRKMMSPKYKVDWVSVPANHPIYQTSVNNFLAYIEGLKQEYKEKMGVSGEQVENIFETYMSSVKSINRLLTDLKNNCYIVGTIGELTPNKIRVSCENDAICLQGMVKTLKVPVYTLVKSMMDETPKDIGTLIRKLQYQKEIALAKARAEAAEKNLDIALSIIKTQLPNFDFSSILNDSLSEQEPNGSKPKFS